MKCSECGGDVTSMQYSIYHTDGSSSGFYHCQKCGRKKEWFIQGPGEPTINMGEDMKVETKHMNKDGKADEFEIKKNEVQNEKTNDDGSTELDDIVSMRKRARDKE